MKTSRVEKVRVEVKAVHPDAESLLQSARASISLRKAIGLDPVDSVGALFLAACEENVGRNEHLRGPRKLAEALLKDLSHDT